MIRKIKQKSTKDNYIISSNTSEREPIGLVRFTTRHTMRSIENRIIGSSNIISVEAPLNKFLDASAIKKMRRNSQNRLITGNEITEKDF